MLYPRPHGRRREKGRHSPRENIRNTLLIAYLLSFGQNPLPPNSQGANGIRRFTNGQAL
jgi:hypothetical protein